MTPRKLLLVGWDAADWKLIHPLMDSGQMPNLARFVEEGVMADCATLQPVLSPLLWNSITTGKRADQHGILGFTEVDPQGSGVRPVMATSRRTKAIWNILMQHGLRTHVVNWWASHPAEPLNGIVISDSYVRHFPPDQPWPMIPGTVHPDSLTETFRELRVHPAEIDGELLQMFVPRAGEVDQEKDPRLASVARLEAECYSIHAATTWLLHKQPWDFLAVFYPSIDHFSHGFMRYHPPKQDWVDQQLFDLYHDVVNSAYRLHDLMLGTLLYLAGPDATVLIVSDHGFHPDHLRPRGIPRIPAGPAEEHRPLGILAMKGPGILRDERIYGVNLLDVTPTILAAYGLPPGKDMPGRVLAEAFEYTPSLERIESWDKAPGDCGMHAAAGSMSAEDAQAVMEQMIALGYIDRPDQDVQKAVQQCLQERSWNLARVHTHAGRWDKALPLLEDIWDQLPERGDWAMALATCQAKVGLLDEALATAEAAIANDRDTPAARWTLANVRFERGEYEAALEHLLAAEQASPRLPELHLRIGETYLKMRRWPDAERAFRRAVETDPHSGPAHQGLAVCHLRQQRFDLAAEEALEAVGLQHQLPWSHFCLGVALYRLGDRERAVQAFHTALSFHSPVRAAHGWLARIYSRIPEKREQAWEHLRAARELMRRRALGLQARDRTREEAQARAAARAKDKAVREAAQAAEPVLDFVIVSGLPRSGTSLMMQMLAAAGVPLMTDGVHQADEDNPEGYFEWEPVRTLRRHPEVLRQAAGKALKVVSPLVRWLPRKHHYRVLFMSRPAEEVFASQRRMRERRGRPVNADPERVKRALERHRQAVLDDLAKRDNVALLEVDYPSLVRDSGPWIPRLAGFLGLSEPEAARMAAAIRPELHRSRLEQKS